MSTYPRKSPVSPALGSAAGSASAKRAQSTSAYHATRLSQRAPPAARGGMTSPTVFACKKIRLFSYRARTGVEGAGGWALAGEWVNRTLPMAHVRGFRLLLGSCGGRRSAGPDANLVTLQDTSNLRE